MGTIIAFIIRLVGYALLIGIPARIAEYAWQNAGLATVDALRPGHDVAAIVVTVVPFILAVFGFGALRNVAVFIAMYLAGAALTAPFVLARLAAG